MKGRGPNTVPCGTPEVTVIDEEETPSRTTCCVLIANILDPVVQFPCDAKVAEF